MIRIPKTMATQHPDNARAPYFSKDGNAFIGASEETAECVDSFKTLDINEFMWDWEGKFADEAVIDRLFHHYFDYFKEHPLGSDKRLTFRIPNIWQEQGYSLIRALMIILTSEDFARDIKFHHPPIFEVILPMTENAEQLIFIQKSFRELSRLKSKMFFKFKKNTEYVRIIPLFEGVDTQIGGKGILQKYLKLHKKTFGFLPDHMRVFIARSDPAMVSGLVATVLANKIILSDLQDLESETGIRFFPILGPGSLVFRGGFNPSFIRDFAKEYPSVRTATLQSAFRYDYPMAKVKKAIAFYNDRHAGGAQHISKKERAKLIRLVYLLQKFYQSCLNKVLPDLREVFAAFPKRRERHLHIGLLGILSYGRKMKKTALPRAITFTGSFYSIGIPPEFLDAGALLKLSPEEFDLIHRYYKYYAKNLSQAGRFLNRDNLKKLLKGSKGWSKVKQGIQGAENMLNIKFAPETEEEKKHAKLSSLLLSSKHDHKKVGILIGKTGVLRRSLG